MSRRGTIRLVGVFLAMALGLAAAALSLGESPPRASSDTSGSSPEHRSLVPVLARDGKNPTPTPAPTSTPTPTPVPTPARVHYGPPRAMYLPSASIAGNSYIEARDTHYSAGQEVFDTPSNPGWIAWYNEFSTMGRGGQNTLFAAHINYVGYGNGPFRYLTSADVGDRLSIRMDNGDTLRYTVQSVKVIRLQHLDMDAIVYPQLASIRERVTLISCGGTFVPYAGGGGQYDSRVILVAERIIG